jgi:transcriptional regulator with XRE-family HTH domain
VSAMTKKTSKSNTHAFWRVRRLREMKEVTLEDLAKRTGLTKSYVSKVERGISVPSVATALKLADAFEVNVGDLFGVGAPANEYVVVRKDKRKPFVRKGRRTASRLEAITSGLAHGLFEAFITYPPRSRPVDEKRVQHRGQELLFVLKGRVEMSFPHTSVVLAAGDCLLFNGRLPHYTLSVGARPSEALIVVTSDAGSVDSDTVDRSP